VVHEYHITITKNMKQRRWENPVWIYFTSANYMCIYQVRVVEKYKNWKVNGVGAPTIKCGNCGKNGHDETTCRYGLRVTFPYPLNDHLKLILNKRLNYSDIFSGHRSNYEKEWGYLWWNGKDKFDKIKGEIEQLIKEQIITTNPIQVNNMLRECYFCGYIALSKDDPHLLNKCNVKNTFSLINLKTIDYEVNETVISKEEEKSDDIQVETNPPENEKEEKGKTLSFAQIMDVDKSEELTDSQVTLSGDVHNNGDTEQIIATLVENLNPLQKPTIDKEEQKKSGKRKGELTNETNENESDTTTKQKQQQKRKRKKGELKQIKKKRKNSVNKINLDIKTNLDLNKITFISHNLNSNKKLLNYYVLSIDSLHVYMLQDIGQGNVNEINMVIKEKNLPITFISNTSVTNRARSVALVIGNSWTVLNIFKNKSGSVIGALLFNHEEVIAVLSVYLPPRLDYRKNSKVLKSQKRISEALETYDDIKSWLKEIQITKWLIGGDMNETRSVLDRNSNEIKESKDMIERDNFINEFLNDMEGVDIWRSLNRNQKGHTRYAKESSSRLDYFIQKNMV